MGRGRVKRKEVEGGDGWTVITHGVGRLSLGEGKGKGKDGKNGSGGGDDKARDSTAGMPGEVEGLTVEMLLSDFKARQGRWRDTACARHIESVLAKRSWKVADAVCIGIGSFSRDWAHRHRSMWQLVLFMAVVEHRTSPSHSPVPRKQISILTTPSSPPPQPLPHPPRARTRLHTHRPLIPRPPAHRSHHHQHSHTHPQLHILLLPLRRLVLTPPVFPKG